MQRTGVYLIVLMASTSLSTSAAAVPPSLPMAGTTAYLGISMDAMSEAMCAAFSLGPDCGVLVDDVEPGGPAEKAGLKKGDVITSLDGRRMRTPADVGREVGRSQPGRKLRIEVIRAGSTRKLSATLSKAPRGWSGSWSWSWPRSGHNTQQPRWPRQMDKWLKQFKHNWSSPPLPPRQRQQQRWRDRLRKLEEQMRQLREEVERLKRGGKGKRGKSKRGNTGTAL